jgi:sugar phosphate isomerase/epimerase
VQIVDNVDLLALDQRCAGELRRVADEVGVHVEIGTRSYRANDVRRLIRLAGLFDSQGIRVVGMDLRRLEALLARIDDVRKAWGGHVLVENYSPVRTDDLLQVIRTGSDWVRTCVDTANSIPTGEWPLETTSKLLPLADCVHIKDFRFDPGRDGIGFVLTGAPLGRGQQDLGAIVRAALAAETHPYFIQEQWLPWQGNQRKTLAVERKWLEEGLSVLQSAIADAG